MDAQREHNNVIGLSQAVDGPTPEPFHGIAVDSLRAQSKELLSLAERLGPEFDQTVQMILSCQGRIIVSGMGKSGLVGKKIAATFASTGTPSFYLHPAEAFHGDLGMIRPDDLLILISYSGETDEVIKLLPSVKQFGCRIISLVGAIRSTLAEASDVALDISVEREVCPNNLAPTTSTLVTMGMGDALAVALIKARDFKPMDFARYHPGGSLGRQLLTRVRDAMTTHLPIVTAETTVHDALFTMTSGRMGLALVMDDRKLLGIITDGDLRRAMLKDSQLLDKPVLQFSNLNPVKVQADAMLSEAEDIMHREKVRVLIVEGGRSDSDSDVCGILEIFE